MSTVTIEVGQERGSDLFDVLADLLPDDVVLSAQGDTLTVTADEDPFDVVATMAHDWGFAETVDVAVSADGRNTQAVAFVREAS